jgi:hypothetical protein
MSENLSMVALKNAGTLGFVQNTAFRILDMFPSSGKREETYSAGSVRES